MPEPRPTFFYALHAKCVCLREVIGPSRSNKEPEFAPEVVEQFYAAIRERGWTQDPLGLWTCGVACPGQPPWVGEFKRLAAEGRLPAGYKIKTINPDFYGTATVANLEGGE